MTKREYNNQWYKEHPEYNRVKTQKWRDQHPGYAQEFKQKNPNYHRKYTLKKYGLTIEDFEELANHQNLLCAICGRERKLHVDHDHSSGMVRGLLCQPCNTSLGHFNERVQTLSDSITYLQGKPDDYLAWGG
jgi:hypothetical protein